MVTENIDICPFLNWSCVVRARYSRPSKEREENKNKNKAMDYRKSILGQKCNKCDNGVFKANAI